MIKTAIKAAKKAGEVLMQYYGNVEVRYKKGPAFRRETVTEADKKSEETIVNILKKKFPPHGIYAEEQNRTNLEAEYVWYIDPLDGTQSFVRHMPIFGISIGLARSKKPILGVLYFPALNLLVHAERRKGAYVNNKEIKVSTRPLDESLYYIGGVELRTGLFWPKGSDKVGWVKVFDASAFELAQIAMGDAELYIFKNAPPYDVVAGAIIVEEAGGKVTDDKGNPWTTESKTIIASNGKIHDSVLKLLNT